MSDSHQVTEGDVAGIDGLAEFAQAGRVPPVEDARELHVLSATVVVGGRRFVKCSCGLVLEIFSDGYSSCPIGGVEAFYSDAIRRAREEWGFWVAYWRERSDFEQAELHRLAGSTGSGVERE